MSTFFQDKATDVDANMAKHPITDDIKMVASERAILQHMDLLLMQDEDALLFRPYVCAGLRKKLFEVWSPHERNTLIQKIRNTLRHERRIRVLDVTVEAVEHDMEIVVRFMMVDTDKELVYKSTLKKVI